VGQGVHELVAREGHGEHFDDAHAFTDLDRLLGHGDDDDGDAQASMAHLLSHVEAVDLALQQRIDHERVRTEFTDLVHDRPPVGHRVEQADLLLVLQQVAHVLRDLCDVLDQ
jgi:hypothetical protein